MAGAVLMVPPVVDTGDVSVVAKDGLLESSFRRCSWKEDEVHSEIEAAQKKPRTKNQNGGRSMAPLFRKHFFAVDCVVCLFVLGFPG